MKSIFTIVPGPIYCLPQISSTRKRIALEHTITVPRDMPVLYDREAFMKEHVSVP